MHLLPSARDGWAAGAEAERMLALAVGFDLAILRFEAFDVFAHGVEQQLEMLRSHNNARMNARSWDAGRDAGEVNDKLGRRMGDDCEIGINSFRFFFAEFDLELLLDRRWWIVFWHCKIFETCSSGSILPVLPGRLMSLLFEFVRFFVCGFRVFRPVCEGIGACQ